MAILNRKPRPPEKFIGYYELIEALGKPSCALCRRVNDSARSAIHSLLYESVTDPLIRGELRMTRGFCNCHACMAVANGDAFGLSIIYEDLINCQLAELERNNRLPPHYTTHCLICQLVEESENHALGICRDHFLEEELQTALKNADAFCVRHFALLLDLLPKGEARRRLQQWEKEKLMALRQQLSEFVRKNNYRFQHEKITEEEANAWQRAMEWAVGKLQVS